MSGLAQYPCNLKFICLMDDLGIFCFGGDLGFDYLVGVAGVHGLTVSQSHGSYEMSTSLCVRTSTNFFREKCFVA